VKRALLLATVSLVGCGGGQARQVALPPPPSLAKRCGDVRVQARTLWFTASDGTRLDGAELGNGPRGVVLLHESPADLCGWAPYAKTLARRGFHVLLVDLRAFGVSHRGPYGGPRGARADVRGAVTELKQLGAKRAVVVGASYGGVVALVAAPALGSQITGVASLSGETSLGGGPSALNALAAVRRIRVPLLIMGSREDRYLSEAEARQFVRAAGSTQVSLAEFAGTFHGWDLLSSSPQRRRADDILVKFLRRVTE
jgi:alpha-beta hydrolase superfamily lysophospholipase